jgi:hypothetical protein
MSTAFLLDRFTRFYGPLMSSASAGSAFCRRRHEAGRAESLSPRAQVGADLVQATDGGRGHSTSDPVQPFLVIGLLVSAQRWSVMMNVPSTFILSAGRRVACCALFPECSRRVFL